MFYAVTPRSVVVLKKKSALDEDEKKIWGNQPAATVKRIDVDANRLNLTEKRLLLLTEVGSKDSGVTVGPKAANLGQLAGYFPREVAPGIVIPFGIFHDHISRVLDDSGTPLIEQIKAAVTRAEQMRESGASPQAVSAFIYPKLAHFRAVIQKMTLLEGFQKDLVRKMEETFGADGSYGVFVRSDTNAEDLPGFTGAGLNLTVPNQVGSRNILNSIRNVWASPYTERAYDWRSRALKGTENVYPSVIVMRAVPSDKSGVIVTVDLETGRDDLTTVNVSEGVSAVVDGGVAESLLLSADGEVKLLQQCRATYRKICKPEGGFQNIPATGGDAVLTREEIAQLRQMVAEVKRKYPPMKSEAGMVLPWDIEFGFEKGALRLFQIRPLARFQEWKVLEALSRLEGPSQAERRVRLEENPMP
jgi:phosphoenolpyruvate synthase/pyruvate phosphate dikinase